MLYKLAFSLVAALVLFFAPCQAQTLTEPSSPNQERTESLFDVASENARRGESFLRFKAGVVYLVGVHTGMEFWLGNFAVSGRLVAGLIPQFVEFDGFVHLGGPRFNVYGGIGHRDATSKDGRVWVVGAEIDTADPYEPFGYGFFVDYHNPWGDESRATRGIVFGANISMALGGG